MSSSYAHTPTRKTRIFVFLALLIGSAVLPWWVILGASLLVLMKYPAYELALIGLMIDGLYGAPGSVWFGIQFFCTGILAAAILLAPLAKRSIIFYR